MAKKFNPAPGWPSAPDGWLPYEGWQPDPSWPAAPEGWPLVIDDGQSEPSTGGAASRFKRFVQDFTSSSAGHADAEAGSPDVIWSAKGQPITGIGGGRYRLTAQTLYFEAGVLTTNAQQVPTRLLCDIDLQQTFAQKARGVGDVVIHVQRPTGLERVVLRDLPSPREAVNVIARVAEEARLGAHRLANTHHYTADAGTAPASVAGATQPAPAPAGQPEVDLMDQLRKLGELRDAGILTEEEFAAKKAEILARM